MMCLRAECCTVNNSECYYSVKARGKLPATSVGDETVKVSIRRQGKRASALGGSE